MNPGRELDSLIAENVMGLREKLLAAGSQSEYEQVRREIEYCPEYSSDPAAAYELKLRLDDMDFLCLTRRLEKGGKWECSLSQYYPDPTGKRESHTAVGDTEMHAVCLAALKAVK